MKKDGERSILGNHVPLSKAEAHLRLFLEGLVKRGSHVLLLIICNDHAGMEAARKIVFTGVPWQRCQFYLQQNKQSYVPRVGMHRDVAEEIRTIFNALDSELQKTISRNWWRYM